MRKSFLYLLMSAMVLIGMGTLKSCKDYEDDILGQVRIDQAIQDATLRDLLQACHDTCQAKWQDLYQLQQNCSTNCAKEHARLNHLIDSLGTVLGGKVDTADLNEKLQLIWDTLGVHRTDLSALFDSINAHRTAITALELADEALKQSIKDLETAYKKADTLINERIDNLEGKVKENKDSITYLMGKVTEIKTTLDKVVARLEVVEANYAKLNSKVDSLYILVDGKIEKLNDKIDLVKNELNERIDRVYYTISEIQNTINGIQQNVLDLTKLYATLDGRLYRVELQAAEALELAKNNKAWIDAFKLSYTDDTIAANNKLNNFITSINSQIAQAQKDYDEAIEALQKQDSILTDSLVNIVDKKIETLDDKVDLLDTKVDSLHKLNLIADSILNDKIDSLEKRVKANEDSIKAINKKISELTSRVDKVEQSQKALVTSIELNAAVNPVFGTFNLPANIRNNTLMGYYGVTEKSGFFPSKTGSGAYVDDKYALTEADWNIIGFDNADRFKYNSGEIVANTSDEEGDSIDLGTLYVTVNPTKADFTGTEFDLVNSLDEKAAAVLSDLQPSTHKIDFGYTRAKTTDAAKNGFYEAKVTIAKDDAEAATIHTDGIKEAVTQLVKKAEGANITIDKKGVHYSNSYVLNVSDVAVKILDNMSGITDAYAVRASWDDDLIGDTRSVYSQYGLAAVPVRSFTGYTSFQDFNYQTIPGYEAAWNLIDKFGKAAKDAMETMVGKVQKIIDDVEIENVSFDAPDESLGNYTIDMSINVPAGTKVKVGDNGYLYIYDDKGKVLGMVPGNAKMVDGVVVFTFNSKEINLYPYIQPVFKAIEEAYGDVNDTYEDLRKLFDNVNGLLADIKSYESKVDTATGALQSLLDAINTRVVNFVNSANYRMQPIIVANDTKGAHILSQAKNVPSEIEASTQLILTNYVGEIIAPALKKHIVCTNVIKGTASAQDDSNECMKKLEALNSANEDFNKVLNGDVTRISVKGFESGYTYEIALSALDYQGFQTTRKFYVTVK